MKTPNSPIRSYRWLFNIIFGIAIGFGISYAMHYYHYEPFACTTPVVTEARQFGKNFCLHRTRRCAKRLPIWHLG
jgi:hypothetical protein